MPRTLTPSPSKRVAVKKAVNRVKANPVGVGKQKARRLLNQWRVVRSQSEMSEERQEELRLQMLDTLERMGEEDDKGNLFINFDEPVKVEDMRGKIFNFLGIKRERRLSTPTPDQEKTENLLVAKKLWFTSAQEKALQELRLGCRFAKISISVDAEAVATAVFNGLITDKEYESILQPQREVFAFKPIEEK